MASLRAVAYPLVQEARRWPPPSPRLIWPVRLSVVVTWRRDPTSVCWPSFPPPVPPAGAPFPPRGLVGSIPPLRRYYETLRLLAVHPPALRCLRPAVPSEHLRLRSVGRQVLRPRPRAWCAGARAPAVFTMETTRPPGVPGNPPARMPRAPTPARSPPPRPLRRGEMTFRPTHDVGPRTQCISGLNYAAYGLPVNASRPGSPQAHASLGSGWRPTLAGWDWIPTGFRTRFRRSHHGILSPLTGLSRHTRRCTPPARCAAPNDGWRQSHRRRWPWSSRRARSGGSGPRARGRCR